MTTTPKKSASPNAGPTKDTQNYVSNVLGIQGDGRPDVVGGVCDQQTVEETMSVLRGYNLDYGLCSENTLAHQWYMDTWVRPDDAARKEMEAVLKNPRLSQDQKIESQYEILKEKYTGKNATDETREKWRKIQEDKKEIDNKFDRKISAPTDGKYSEKVVKICSLPKNYRNCVGRDAGDKIKSYFPQFANALNEKHGTKVDIAQISKWENEEIGPSRSGYIPWGKGAAGNRSGVTVGTGFDIGQMNEKDLNRYPLKEETKRKLRPYLNLKQQEACNKFAAQPMEPLSEDEVRDIDRAKFDEVIKDTKNSWNELNPVKRFEELEPEQQTVLASRTMQKGPGWFGETTYNGFLASAKADDWATAQMR